MKFLAKTISLPKEELDFGLEQAAKLAKPTRSEPNFSQYIRNLIIEDKERDERKKPKRT